MKYNIIWTKKTTREYKKAIKTLFRVHGETVNGLSTANIPPDLEERFWKGIELGYYRLFNNETEV